MRFLRQAIFGCLLLLMLFTTRAAPVAAAGPALFGSGSVHASTTAADFTVALDDAQPLSFFYQDVAFDPPRTLTLDATAQVDCLGDLFGGQAVRLTGAGYDSISSEALSIQVYLVDGGAEGPDRFSLKASRADGTVEIFVPMRALDSGEIAFSCGG